MNRTVKETLKAVGWMFAGAVLLTVGWIAFGHLILGALFDLDETHGLQGPIMVESGDEESPGGDIRHSPRYHQSTMSYRYAPNAAPATPDDHAKARAGWSPDAPAPLSFGHAVTGHRVTSGSGAMLNYQRYSDDVEPPAVTDRAVFEKLTVFLPEDIQDDYGFLSLSDNPEIIVFWSRGSPNLESKVMCAGYATSGEIEYRRVAGKLEAKLSVEINASGTVQPDGRKCEPFTFRLSTEFWSTRVERLGEWGGGGWGRVSALECMPSQ